MLSSYRKVFEVVFVCTLFMILGPALILLNQYILRALKFPYPMFLSGLGVSIEDFDYSSLISDV